MKPDFAKRRRRLGNLIQERGLDALLTSDANDIFYYTGYSGLEDDRVFMVFPAEGRPKLLVSPLENDALTKYPDVAYIQNTKDFIGRLKGFAKLGYDERSLNLLLFQQMKRNLKANLKPSGKIMETLRIVKDAYEIGQIKKAVEITGMVMKKTSESLYGKTEKRAAYGIEIEFRKLGVTEAFESIVCSGRHSAFVHHKPDQIMIKAKDVVLVDTGCRFNRYCSDITRMFFRRLNQKQKRIYEDVKHAHDELIGAVRAGVAYRELEDLQKRLFSRSGYKVMHGLGHGLGLSVHESAGDVLKENAILTIEPGVYIKGFGGFRVEDMVLVRKNGAETLSKSLPIL